MIKGKISGMSEKKPFLKPVGGKERARSHDEVGAEFIQVLGAISGAETGDNGANEVNRVESRIVTLESKGQSGHPFLARLAMQKLRELGETGHVDKVTVVTADSATHVESPPIR